MLFCIFLYATKIYQFKAKDTEIYKYLICLGNILQDFAVNDMKKEDWMDACTNLLLIIILSVLVRLWIFISMWLLFIII